jgi:hypothetical protein
MNEKPFFIFQKKLFSQGSELTTFPKVGKSVFWIEKTLSHFCE